MEVIIYRGISGVGKSSHIKANFPGAKIFSTDDYWWTDDKWVFDPTKLGDAHNWNFLNYTTFLQDKQEAQEFNHYPDKKIIIDNTNISQFEFSPYYRIAEIYGYPVKIVTLFCSPLTAAIRNSHEVPLHVIEGMYKRLMMTEIPSWWNHSVEITESTGGEKTTCVECGQYIPVSLLHCHCRIGKLNNSDFPSKV